MATLVCKIEMSKTAGITVTVENADGKITQTIVMDGTAITTTVKGEQKTSTITQKDESIEIKCDQGGDPVSTITQKPDSIAIACNTFTLDVENYTCTAKKAYKVTSSEDVIQLTCDKDMTLTSNSGKISQSASSDMALSGGGKVTIEASSDAKLSGQNATVSGSSKAELSGAQVTVSGSSKLEATSSGTAKFGGSATTISGSTISVG